MSTLTVKHAVQQMKCELVNHKVSIVDEKKLFEIAKNNLDIFCERCGAHLSIEKDESNKEYYYQSEL